MASRLANCCRSVLTELGEKRSFATSSIPKMKPATVPISALSAKQEKVLDKVEKRAAYWNADYVPIYAVGAFVTLAVGFAIHSAKQQLVHAPAVSLRKSKRESLPEVDDPDAVIGSADKFINKSFFRKVAHVQDYRNSVHDPSRPNPFTAPRKAETLKSVGVEPSRHQSFVRPYV